MPLTQVDQGLLGQYAQYTGFKNRLINGQMAIAQRGTSVNSLGVGGANYYGLDRWGGFRGAYATGLDVSRQAGFNGFQYCMRVQRTSGNTNSANGLYVAQIIETLNCFDLAGQNVTLSFYARTGANYSGGALSVTVQTSTTVDDSFTNLTSGTFSAGTISASPTISSTGTLYTVTGTIPSSAKTIAVQIGWTPSGTAGANDYIELTGVQLEKGSTATSFDYRPYGTELALCQRYCEVIRPSGATTYAQIGVGQAYSTTQAQIGYFYQVAKRAQPTVTYDTASKYCLVNATDGAVACSAVVTGRSDVTSLAINVTIGSANLTAGNATRLLDNNTSNPVTIISAEL